MNYAKVAIVDKNTLRIEEDVKAGTLIDLTSLISVDTSKIEESILIHENKVYEDKVRTLEKNLRLEYETNLTNEKSKLLEETSKEKEKLVKLSSELELELKNELTKLTSQLNSIKEVTKKDLEIKHLNEIKELENKINEKTQEMLLSKKEFESKLKEVESSIDKAKMTKDLEYQKKVQDLQNDLLTLKNKFENDQKISELENIQKISNLDQKHKEEKLELQTKMDDILRDKRQLNIKQIGESLEVWCDNEFNATNLVMPDNITWNKDNQNVAGAKADFIYKVYATEEKKEDQILTSAILEMKSEDKSSSNQQNINAIYRKLDKDRLNKNLEYAILVSELETDLDINNDIPIKRVSGYDKMFVVRPHYFMVLLNIITAFGMKYKDLLLAEELERIKFKDEEDIMSEFEALKDEILDNSINHIRTHLGTISAQSDAINKANERLMNSVNIILNTHLNTVYNKINDFKINRIVNKIKG